MGTTRVRSVAAGVLAVAVAVVVPLLAAPSAEAAAYRYWSYWWGGPAGWTYASAGAATHRPDDGTVEGWRFAVSGDGAAAARSPRALPDFAALCGSTPAVDGRKRIGVVIDYGTSADAPPGEDPPAARGACAVVATSATGAAVLAAVGAYRVDAGLVCGIDGYPARECAALVAAPATTSPSATRSTAAPGSRPAPVAPIPSTSTPPPATTTVTSAAPATSAASSGPHPTVAPSTTATTTPPPAPTTSAGGSAAGAPVAVPSTSPSTSPSGSPAEPLVALATVPASTSGGSGGLPTGVIVGVLLVGALAGVGAWLTRRNG